VNARTLIKLTIQLFASSRGASSLGSEFPDALVPALLRLFERVRAEVCRKAGGAGGQVRKDNQNELHDAFDAFDAFAAFAVIASVTSRCRCCGPPSCGAGCLYPSASSRTHAVRPGSLPRPRYLSKSGTHNSSDLASTSAPSSAERCVVRVPRSSVSPERPIQGPLPNGEGGVAEIRKRKSVQSNRKQCCCVPVLPGGREVLASVAVSALRI
jgi:class 3 adenylate cyclase